MWEMSKILVNSYSENDYSNLYFMRLPGDIAAREGLTGFSHLKGFAQLAYCSISTAQCKFVLPGGITTLLDDFNNLKTTLLE
mmetsp:Transcript_25321/g.36749  ORF Transcript_25321/g.36749 Transcript_25321/m.36749 type:complete len:82 (+) Transcript_25321:973-1218(+)